jgi:biotin carboxyl carrier protein
MKARVKIEGKTFDVEVESLQTQPVIARVDGVTIEVWLESSSSADQKSVTSATVVNDKRSELHAPIPGTIVSIAVKAGDSVAYGQEICVLDAMKMKNPIRSPRDGEIDAVLITLGQTVKHNDVLVTFTRSDPA